MKRILPTPILSLILLAGIVVISGFMLKSDSVVGMLQGKLSAYSKSAKAEKVYVQFDKPFYKPGDDIWFTAYVKDAIKHTTSEHSAFVYVELLDPAGNKIKKHRLLVKNGSAQGDFKIGKDDAGGMYKVRAYTNLMQNFETDWFFEKELQVQAVIMPRLLMKLDYVKESYGAGDKVSAIVSLRTLENKPLANYEFSYQVNLAGEKAFSGNSATDTNGESVVQFDLPEDLSTSDGLLNIMIEYKGNNESISRSVPILFDNIHVSFFPEGGNMVDKVSGKVAFKALDAYGKPADVSGTVKNAKGETVAQFSSYHDGMGAFELTPSDKEQYYAEIIKPKGIKSTFQLPVVLSKAYALQVEQNNDELYIQAYSPLKDSLTIVVQVRGEMYLSKTIFSADKTENVAFNTKNLPAGVAQITLFDYKGIERCERLVFVNKHKTMNVSITADKEKYLPREKVTLDIETTDEDGLPIPATLSLAVVDDKVVSFADDKQDNILSYMLLSSDIKGDIHEPSFYFDETEEKANRALDYLLMTQGWRRFVWEDVVDGSYAKPHKFSAEKAVVGGKVHVGENEQKEGIRIYEVSTGQETFTDSEGRYEFKGMDLSSQRVLRMIFNDGIEKMIYVHKYGDDYDFIRGIYGTVYAGGTRNPVANVDVYLHTGDKIARTDINGKYSVETIPDHHQSIYFDYNGSSSDPISVFKKTRFDCEVTQYDTYELYFYDDEMDGFEGDFTLDEGIIIPEEIEIQMVENDVEDDGEINIEPEAKEPDAEKIEEKKAVVQDKTVELVAALKREADPDGGMDKVVLNSETSILMDFEELEEEPYAGLDVREITGEKESYYRARRYYLPYYRSTAHTGARTDFRETIYWNPVIETNANGKASVSFYNSDAVTAFRATAEGFSTSGMTGREEFVYYTQLPFSMDTKFPAYLTFEDKVAIPVTLHNNSELDIAGNLSIDAPECLKLSKPFKSYIMIPANESITVFAEYTVLAKKGDYAIRISFEGNGEKDSFMQTFEVLPKGFPAVVSYSNNAVKKNFSFSANEIVPGSMEVSFTAYPNVLADMMGGIESILRAPYGCFEQTSSSTYPNLLALDYMNETGDISPAVLQKAEKFVDKGYKRLVSFETKENGYEWFGSVPAHEGLTAYGLMEFVDMQAVYDNVDIEMVQRTKEWLYASRDGKGNFGVDRLKYKNFGNASQPVTNAYIVYALSEAGMADFEQEYKLALGTALHSSDSYQLALLANTAAILGKKPDYKTLIEKLTTQIKSKKGAEGLTVDHTMTRSYGKSAQVETASLVLLAYLHAEKKDVAMIKRLVDFLISSRSGYGGFGSTQATILALKAITEYAKYAKTEETGGKIEVLHSEKVVSNHTYEKGATEEIKLDGLEKHCVEGENKMGVYFKGVEKGMPYSVNASWTTYTPNSNPECKIGLETNVNQSKVKVGGTVRLTTILSNKTTEGQPMTVALIGIPSGLSPQPWQLKELQEKEAFDYYEIRKNYLVLYYRQMQPNEEKIIKLDLKAEISGTFEAVASSAYLYYTNEYKTWHKGEKIVVVN